MTRPLPDIAAELAEVERAWHALGAGPDPVAELRAEVRRLRRAIRGLAVAGGGDVDRLLHRGLDDAGLRVGRAFRPGRTHKAGSAEAILRHCLRSLGLSAAYRRGELTGLQALELLAEIREYARGWLRHEAEQLIRHYGRAVDGDSGRGEGSGLAHDGMPLESGRGLVGDAVVSVRPAGGHQQQARGLGSAMRRHVGRFFDRARNFIRESILAGAMALSGPEGLDDEDMDEADRQHAVQVKFLDQFHRDVETRTPPELAEPSGIALENPMSAAEFANRASSYAGGVWSGAHGVDRRKAIRQGHAVAERRFHLNDDEQHACSVCLEQSSLGWVPIGTLLPVGDSTCLAIHCDCYYVYRLADGSEFITARGWRRAA